MSLQELVDVGHAGRGGIWRTGGSRVGLIHRRVHELPVGGLIAQDEPAVAVALQGINHSHRRAALFYAEGSVSLGLIAIYGDRFNGHIECR